MLVLPGKRYGSSSRFTADTCQLVAREGKTEVNNFGPFFLSFKIDVYEYGVKGCDRIRWLVINPTVVR